MLSRLSLSLNLMAETICCVVLLTMTLVVALQVVCRYLLGASLPWSEEFARYSLVWITFLGGSIALKKRAHMGLQTLRDALPPKARNLIETITLIAILGFLSTVTLKGIQLAFFNMLQRSPAMGLPVGMVYLAIPTGSVLMLVHVMEQLAASVRGFPVQKPGKDS